MRINTRIRYGLRTMIEIANSENSSGVLQKDIAAKQNISFKYLDSIISALKLKGLINTQKGKGSGYILSRPASEITMFDIYTAFETISVVDCLQNNTVCEISEHCMAQCYWNEFKMDFSQILKKKTLETLIKEYSNHKEIFV
jgi:Rrf2 family transcriptional regulator, iron-sulfur cluster assembly transcription factor